MSIIGAFLVTMAALLGSSPVAWVTDSTGATHHHCVDTGPTWCADGARFDDWNDRGPIIIDRADRAHD